MALGDPDTPGLVLFTIALSAFGHALMGNEEEGIEALDPAEMWADLHSKYGTWVTPEGENKLNALTTGLRGGMFWTDLEVFMAVATSLFDGDLGDLISVGFEDLSATELMWAILEMGLAWDSDETPGFSLDVQQYIEDVLMREQEEQTKNARAVERSYLEMLEQLRELGVPVSMLRALDEEYSEVMDALEEGQLV